MSCFTLFHFFLIRALLGDEGVEMAKKLNQGDKVVPFLQSRSVKQLGEKNFNKFLGKYSEQNLCFK